MRGLAGHHLDTPELMGEELGTQGTLTVKNTGETQPCQLPLLPVRAAHLHFPSDPRGEWDVQRRGTSGTGCLWCSVG